MNTLQKLDQHDIGILIDDTHGIYVYVELFYLAENCGWDGYTPNMDSLDDMIEDMVWQADEALDWLNDNVCADGIRIGWHDGAIMVMPNEWWEEES
tara:strand:- start:788 stop:1075 length:288 start_codon:yes stop_codon:yes gene_type:complete